MNFRLVDEYGRQIDLDRNLGKLRSEHAQSAREVFQEVAASAVSQLGSQSGQLQNHDQSQARGLQSLQELKGLRTSDQGERSHSSSMVAQHNLSAGTMPSLSQTEQIKDWCFGELPEMLEIKRGKQTLYGYPALVDHQTHCDIEVFDDPEIARRNHRQGLRRLFALPMKETIKSLHKQLPGARDLSLLFMNIGSSDELMTQIIELALDREITWQLQSKQHMGQAVLISLQHLVAASRLRSLRAGPCPVWRLPSRVGKPNRPGVGTECGHRRCHKI
jgi:ATP-dependent helicase HrpA